MIEVEALAKRFKGPGGRVVEAVREVGFTARDGRITGLIGPNGAGKTTTLRILCGLMKPDAGRATIDGLDVVAETRAAQARLGVLPDNRGLYPRLTAREHVRYFGRLHGLKGAELERRIGVLAERLGMDDVLDRRAKGFSKGQTLKVALARALVHEPPNLLLDEPTNGLDIASSRAMRELIRGFRDQGRCVVFCSHIMSEVAALCDHLVVIADGRVVAEGAVDELRARTGLQDLEEVFLSLTGQSLDAPTPPAVAPATAAS
ncbi:ATP-binding cassette domain-containing protein [Roseospirillum parvum]|uniref:Sodium transport system ATP-binding protein n=1 Tax=Roseospirillum parvum TaxID=83401 RepID=A0A1G7ZNJ9_9PROT|nr:ATP-binding cassette domain-containing protein [Roseospirillum parvum]SDH10229.1 sodium transport system ATP-binding protein [Roseospirillum parvum]